MIQEQETKYYEGNPSCGVEPSESVYYLYETPVERFFRVMFNKLNS